MTAPRAIGCSATLWPKGTALRSCARLRRQRVAGLQVLQGDRDLVGRAEPEGRC